ncbi:S66 peptidase family protein [Mangrovimonas xylaniphaga]|uniref:S66 peptidase family protein n=1 Tax=Mangrovimonas xylaniphaga TaxID=1645915 RepID=UPI0009E8375C|nr:LD-carboxypeptidase [Mangrovimonas xylaniphaga]
MSKNIQLVFLCCALWFFAMTTGNAQQSNSQTPNKLIQPEYLKVGDTVAIVAPSGILKNREDEVQGAIALLESWGLYAKVGAHVFSQDNHFAGTDAQRAADFQKALDDPAVSAIWCARGGYGSVRILDRLDYTKFKQHPKWLIGYSDITALHSQIHNLGYETLHALMCVSLTKDLAEIQDTVETFKKALFGESLSYSLNGSSYNRTGSVTAPLVGGNLTMLHTMLGSETSLDTSGDILFIEEIGEYKYHIDRMLQSLKRAGYFENCKGVLVGDMSNLRKNTTPWGTSIEQLILDALSDYDFPIAFNMPAGHEKDNRAMILGRTIEMTVTKEGTTVVFME